MQHAPNATEQADYAIRQIADCFPHTDSLPVFTDIHLRLDTVRGELAATDDEGNPIGQWAFTPESADDEGAQASAIRCLRWQLHAAADLIGGMGVAKPFSFVMESDDGEPLAELFVADDETVVIGGDLMAGLDDDLDSFLRMLMTD